MEDEYTRPILEFCQAVNNIRADLEVFSKQHTNAKEDRDQLMNHYNQKILPNLCELKRLNRLTREMGEVKNKNVDALNAELVLLREQCDNITFEAKCLEHEVNGAKRRLSPTKPARVDGQGDMQMQNVESNGNDMSFFDMERVSQMDHVTRLQVLESEEAKRKSLQEKLSEVTSETTQIELACQTSEDMLNGVKPYIKQLLEKIEMDDANR